MSPVTVDTAKLDSMIATNPGKIADEVGKAAFRILGRAQTVTPRDPARPPIDPTQQVTGALRANTDVTKEDDRGLVQHVNYYQEYALFQELGAPAINLPARPFLTPSVEAENDAFIAAIAKVVSGE